MTVGVFLPIDYIALPFILNFQVNVMIVSAVMSFVAVVIVFVYSCVTLSYGEEDDEIFHAHPVPEVVHYIYKTLLIV